MKKILFIVLILFVFTPTIFAETINLKTKVTLTGKEMEGNEFTFYLLDGKKNIIKEATNDKNGVIDFGEIEIPDEPPLYKTETNTFFYVSQKNKGEEGFTYDDKEILIRVKKDYTTEEISYYSFVIDSLEEEYKSKIPKYDYVEPYHATEEELEGESYGVLDAETKTLSFIRIKDFDTSSFTIPFDSDLDNPNRAVDENNNKVYYRGGEDSAERLATILHETYQFNDTEEIVPIKIEFKEAFKPRYTALNYVKNYTIGIFSANTLKNKEIDFSHFDTSNITDMSYAFDGTDAEKLDLTSFDTSKVTTTFYMFVNSRTLVELDLRSFTFESLVNASYMFGYCENLKTLKISNHSTTDVIEYVSYMFTSTPNLDTIDLSWLVIDIDTIKSMTSIFSNCGFEYMDLSHWVFENPERSIFESAFYLPRLKYIDISNITTPLCGSYASADFNFEPEVIEVIKISDKFNGIYGMILYPFTDMFSETTGEYSHALSGAGRMACEYYPGGNYYNVKNTAVLGESSELESDYFANSYEKPVKENPETRDIVLVALLIMVVSFCTILVLKKRKA